MRASPFSGTSPFFAPLFPLLFTLVAFSVIAVPLHEETGSITLTNDHGRITADASPSNTITVNFRNPGVIGDGGDGGGGDGGGGADEVTDLCAQPVPSTTHQFDRLEPGKEYVVRTHTAQFLLRELRFQVLENRSDVLFRISHVVNLECETLPPVPSELVALGYDRLDHLGLGRNEATAITLLFEIPPALLARLNGSAEQVRFWRFDGQNWQPLSATRNGTRYLASSPGLSYFAATIPSPERPAGAQGPSREEQFETITGQVTSGQAGREAAGTATATDGGGPDGDGLEGGNAPAKPWKRIPIYSLLVLILIGGMIVVYYALQEKEAGKDPVHHDPAKPVLGFVTIDDEAFEDPVERLRAYIDAELRHGHSRDAIERKLLKSGWPSGVIGHVLDSFTPVYLAQCGMHPPHDDEERLARFVTEKVGHGYSAETIRTSLLNAGWEPIVVDAALPKEVTLREAASSSSTPRYTAESLARLRFFIAAERRKGLSDDAIAERLRGAGWRDDALDEALRGG